MASSQASLASGTRSAGPRATMPQPSSTNAESGSARPGVPFTTSSGTTAMRRERASPCTAASPAGRQHPPELRQLALLVVVEQILADPDDPNRGPIGVEQAQQRLGEDPRAGSDRVVLVARLVRPTAPLLARGCQLDAHARAAVDADHHDPMAGRQIGPDLRSDGGSELAAMRPEGRGVVLLR